MNVVNSVHIAGMGKSSIKEFGCDFRKRLDIGSMNGDICSMSPERYSPRNISLRMAVPGDAETILEIYAPYVKETAITFEYDVPTVEEFRKRIEKTLLKYPYLVVEADGDICGYAYASAFHVRAAFEWCAEASIYVRRGYEGMGFGRKMYEALEDILKRQHIINLNASIAVTDCADAYLNDNSKDFHTHMGYRYVGTFRQCGYKFGKWYDLIWMEKMLDKHPDVPQKVLTWREVCEVAGQN